MSWGLRAQIKDLEAECARLRNRLLWAEVELQKIKVQTELDRKRKT
jgi:hypothetical protein